MTQTCSAETKSDEKALLGLKGVVRTSRKTLAGRSFQNLDGFAPAAEWESLSIEVGRENSEWGEGRFQ